MLGRRLLSMVLLAAAVQVTSQMADSMGAKQVDVRIPETIRIRNYKNQETPNAESHNLCTPGIKRLTEREARESKDKLTKLNHSIINTDKVLDTVSHNHSRHGHKVSEIRIDSRISDKDFDGTQVEKYRISNAEETYDEDDLSDKSFGRYDDFYTRKPKDSRVVTRPTIMYPQSVSKQSSTKKTTTSRPYESSPITSRPEFSSSTQHNKRKGTTSRPYNGYQTTNSYDTSKISRVTPSTSFGGNSRPQNVYSATTQNPFFNGPGVKPAPVNVDRAPFTNRPITQRPSYLATRPLDADAITFPEDPDDGSPDLISGKDEDSLTYQQRKRFEDIAEKVCDRYKASETKQLQAIPLLPSPEPVRVNISDCMPRTIPLIVGGKVATIKDFPHMALLGWPKLQVGGYSWKCGGSLISDRFILTAAHCANQERDNTVVTGPPRAVQLGSTYLDDPGALVVKVSTVIRHPKYKPPKSYNDLALVKLVTPVKFSERIKPACLGSPPSPGDSVVATGWGRTETQDQSEELRSVSVPIWDIEDCWSTLGTSKKLPNGPSGDTQICAGERKGGKDTCQGDSGGPAQIQDGCVWRIVAVTSLGRGCGAPHTPGLYAIANTAFIAANAFANEDGGGYQQTNQNGRDQTVNYNARPPKTNSVTNNYNRGGNGNFNGGSNSLNVQKNIVNDFSQDGYRHNNQRRSNGYEVFDFDNDEDTRPPWSSYY